MIPALCLQWQRDDADAAAAALAMQLMINCTALRPLLRMLQVHTAPPS